MVQKRDSLKTRQKIVEAAQEQFAQKGFDGAGVRDIAAAAGVNVALINRYFGSKESLFDQTVMPYFNIDELLNGEKHDFGMRIAKEAIEKTIYSEGVAPNIAFIRSVGSAKVHRQLKDGLEIQIIERLAAWLGGKDSQQRAALIISHLLGFALLRSVIGVSALEVNQAPAITNRLAKVLQSYVDGAA